MKIIGFPDNIDLNPEEHRELGFVKNFVDHRSGVTLNTENFSLVNEAYDRLYTWIYDEYGRFENPPVTITTDSGTEFPFYLDLKPTEIGLNRISTGIQMRKSQGHFFENAEGLTFELLYAKGFLPDSMKIDVPYIIVPDLLEIQRAIAVITVLSLSYQLYQHTLELAKVAAAFLDVVGTGPLTAIAQLIAVIAFYVITVIALIQAILDLKEIYFPKVRYFKAFTDLTLLRQGCLYLGYNLDSIMMTNELQKMATLGKPQAKDGKSIFQLYQNEQSGYLQKGFPTAEDSTPTLASLFQFILDTFDSKVFIYDSIVKLERDSFFSSTASINLVPTLTDQENSDDKYIFNEDGAWGRTFDHWQVDFSDIHSSDINDGMKTEYITEPIVVLNPDLFRLHGLKENSAPFAMAGRKNSLNRVEKMFKSLLGFMDSIANVFGGSSNLAATIEERIGVMVIEQQYFGVTKKLWLDVDADGIGKQPHNFKDILSMDNIHLFFKQGLNVINNNFAIKTMTVPFTDDNFILLLQNNYVIYEPTGEAVEVVNIIWNDRKYSADITIRLPDNSAFNTKTTKLA
jgi:hypothetical protein